MTELPPQFSCKGCPRPFNSEEQERYLNDQPAREGQAPGCEGPTYILTSGVEKVTNIQGVVEFHPREVGRQAIIRFCGLDYQEPPVAEGAKILYADRKDGVRFGVVLNANQTRVVEDLTSAEQTDLANRTHQIYGDTSDVRTTPPDRRSLRVVADTNEPSGTKNNPNTEDNLSRIRLPATGKELWVELNAAASDQNIAEVLDFASGHVSEVKERFIVYAEQSASPFKDEIEGALAELTNDIQEAIKNNREYHNKLSEYLVSNQALENYEIEPVRHNYFKGIEGQARSGHLKEASIEALQVEVQNMVDALTEAMQQLHAIQEVTHIRTNWLDQLSKGSVTSTITDAMLASTLTHLSVRDSFSRLDGLINLLLRYSNSL